jgi:hypothetical protein
MGEGVAHLVVRGHALVGRGRGSAAQQFQSRLSCNRRFSLSYDPILPLPSYTQYSIYVYTVK